MRKLKFPRALFFIFSGLLAIAVPAYATFPGITFVSATGTDVTTYSCSQAHPCATLQYAVNHTLNGGEVDALSGGELTGGNGLIITGSITIDGKGLASISVPYGYTAIEVASGNSDNVVIRGLSLNAQTSPTTSGASNGIDFISGGTLVIEDCSITGFTFYGLVDTSPNAAGVMYVKNTTINGGPIGVYLNLGGGAAILEHVTITGTSTYGVEAVSSAGSIIMNDSLIVGGQYGVAIQPSTTSFTVMMERVTITGATNTGFYLGVGSAGVDSSTFFGNEAGMLTSGGSLRISNNNMYSNTYGISCTSASAKIQTDDNNRHGGPVGIATTGGCPAVTPVYVE